MSDDSTKTMWATFATREAADRAVEHLVQQCGIARTDVFVEPDTEANTAGTASSAVTPPAPTRRSTAKSAFPPISRIPIF